MSTDPVRRAGFIGLGDIGGPMAQRIIDAGFPTVLWARRAQSLEQFAAGTFETAESPADLASRVDVVGVCVWTDDDVRQVVAGDNGLLAGAAPGTVIALHSTVHPSTVRELATAAAARDVHVLDAPISGGREPAIAGTLVLMAGGDEDVVERCRPVFESFATAVVHVGPVGNGQLAKLVNNALLAANFTVADDALTLGKEFGIAPEALTQVMRRGSGASFALDVALASRLSPQVRAQALPRFEKDTEVLVSDISGTDTPTGMLAEAAEEAVRRLTTPPAGWVPNDAP